MVNWCLTVVQLLAQLHKPEVRWQTGLDPFLFYELREHSLFNSEGHQLSRHLVLSTTCWTSNELKQQLKQQLNPPLKLSPCVVLCCWNVKRYSFIITPNEICVKDISNKFLFSMWSPTLHTVCPYLYINSRSCMSWFGYCITVVLYCLELTIQIQFQQHIKHRQILKRSACCCCRTLL